MNAPATPIGTVAALLASQSSIDIAFDERARVRLGTASDTAPDILMALAADTQVTVRAAVAMNVAAPAHVDTVLAQDSDERVRTLLGRKLAGIVPGLAGADRDRMGDAVLATLAHLVEDEADRVRIGIADVLKDMPQAPRVLILRLAQDSAVAVFDPVIRLSPLLTEDDLLALTRAPGAAATVTAVARRANLSETVCDAVAATADSAAITALLENHHAAIREATLDSLIERAAAHEPWHKPLVRRPQLSPAATRALSDIVTTQLLDELASRADLPHAVTSELRRRLSVRLQPDATTSRPEPTLDEALAEANRLADAGLLQEDTLYDAIQCGEARRATALLAVAAEVPVRVVERATTLRSAKALLALVWKAGMTMRIGGPIQVLLGRAAPSGILRATANGQFPLAVDEMRWQIDFLSRMSG
jgi:uncharacterized protein (DUF2336 family)